MPLSLINIMVLFLILKIQKSSQVFHLEEAVYLS